MELELALEIEQLTQTELGQLLGVTPTTVSNWVRRGSINPVSFVLLCELFGTDDWDLQVSSQTGSLGKRMMHRGNPSGNPGVRSPETCQRISRGVRLAKTKSN